MCKINLSYKGACILKTALENQVRMKTEMVEKQNITNEDFLLALKQEINTLESFTQKIENIWGERIRNLKRKHERPSKKIYSSNLETLDNLNKKEND